MFKLKDWGNEYETLGVATLTKSYPLTEEGEKNINEILNVFHSESFQKDDIDGFKRQDIKLSFDLEKKVLKFTATQASPNSDAAKLERILDFLYSQLRKALELKTISQ